MSRKTFILDTNVLLHDPECINKFDDNIIVITGIVIEELDKFKTNEKGSYSEVNANSRRASRLIKELFQGADQELDPVKIAKGVQINERGGVIRIIMPNPKKPLPGPTNDEKILQLVLQNRASFKEPVVMVTKDLNMGLRAIGLGLGYQDYRNDKAKAEVNHIPVIPESLIPGISQVLAQPDKYVAVKDLSSVSYVNGEKDSKPITQGYYLLANGDPKEKLVHVNHQDEIRHVTGDPLLLDGKRNMGVRAKNKEQAAAVDALLNEDKKLVLLTGKAGTGKTMLAIAAALHRARKAYRVNPESIPLAPPKPKFIKGAKPGQNQNPAEEAYVEPTRPEITVYITRPMISMGADMGALPGDIAEKMNPWMEPIYDNLRLMLGPDQVKRLLTEGKLQLQPLAMIRGRTLHNAFLVVDEAQNLTALEAKTIITRAGQNTTVIFTGDPYQIDNPYVDRYSNGLSYVADRMGLEPTVAVVPLTIGERSELSERAAELL